MLAGCPPEVVKALIQQERTSFQHLLLPDLPVSRGESQVAVEFPLYHFLFSGPAKPGGRPLDLIGNRRRAQAAVELVELSLFGPDEAQMQRWGLAEEQAEALARETRWFQLKDASGHPMALESLVKKSVLEEQPVELGWLTIRRVRTNVFHLTSATKETAEIDLTPDRPLLPPYPVAPDLTPSALVKFGVEVLGGGTGFSTAQASCGLAICFNGQYFLIDAIPYLQHHLRARGMARNQIQAMFLSHIHDDHCNVVSLLQYNRRISVLTTPLIYHMLLRKLALTLDRSEEDLGLYFNFIPLTPGEETNFFGLRITPFYSSHSIPTIGATFETTHDNVNYRVIFTGDTQSLADQNRMLKAGVITRERLQEVADAYQRQAQLLIADAGEGALHGDPSDSLKSPAERIVVLHLDKLPERFNAHFTTASSGKRFGVLRGDTDYYLTRAIEFLLEYFPDMPPMWISHLLANQHVLKFNTGDIIIREFTKSDGRVYMMLTGHATVIHHDGVRKHELAQMEAGEIIGEMSVITGRGLRNASVVAASPVIVVAFSEIAFREYVHHQKLEVGLKKIWQHRELLQTLPYMTALQQPVIRELSRQVELRHLPARSAPLRLTGICPAFGLIFPLGVETRLERQDTQVVVAAQSAPLLSQPEVNLVTEAEMEYLVLPPERAQALREKVPAFRFFWQETLGLPLP